MDSLGGAWIRVRGSAKGRWEGCGEQLTRDSKELDYYNDVITKERTEWTDSSVRGQRQKMKFWRRGEEEKTRRLEGNADEGDSRIPGNDYDQAGARPLMHQVRRNVDPGALVGAGIRSNFGGDGVVGKIQEPRVPRLT